jgi:hypothetical protein
VTKDRGVADIELALRLAPHSADVRFIAADAYTYGLPDPERAFAEASLALAWGLDIPGSTPFSPRVTSLSETNKRWRFIW